MKSIGVFCGTAEPKSENQRKEVSKLGTLIVTNGFGLVYGGANCGMMGIIADSVLVNGGDVQGIMLDRWVNEIGHKDLTHMHITKTMFERKQKYIELSDAFVTLPGGGGTLDELFEVFTLRQIGLINSPIALLNIDGYFDYLLKFIDNAVYNGYIKKEHAQMLIIESTAEALIASLKNGIEL